MRSNSPKALAAALVTLALGLGSGGAMAAGSIVQGVMDGCKTELDSYCKTVTAGEGRTLHCLAAHEDKLSGQCEYALYTASAQLDQFVAAFKHVANECAADVKAQCGDVPLGEGRVAQCLKKNEAKVSKTCQQAMKDTQMEVKEDKPAAKK